MPNRRHEQAKQDFKKIERDNQLCEQARPERKRSVTGKNQPVDPAPHDRDEHSDQSGDPQAQQPSSGVPRENAARDVEQYLLAFDSDLAPIVGQQITLSRDNAATAGDRLSLLEQRAGTPFTSLVLGGNVTECDLVASTVVTERIEGFLFDPSANSFVTANGTSVTDNAMRALAVRPGHEATFTCVPPGSGYRVASVGSLADTLRELVMTRLRSPAG